MVSSLSTFITASVFAAKVLADSTSSGSIDSVYNLAANTRFTLPSFTGTYTTIVSVDGTGYTANYIPDTTLPEPSLPGVAVVSVSGSSAITTVSPTAGGANVTTASLSKNNITNTFLDTYTIGDSVSSSSSGTGKSSSSKGAAAAGFGGANVQGIYLGLAAGGVIGLLTLL